METPDWPHMSLMGVDRGVTTGPALQEPCKLKRLHLAVLALSTTLQPKAACSDDTNTARN